MNFSNVKKKPFINASAFKCVVTTFPETGFQEKKFETSDFEIFSPFKCML